MKKIFASLVVAFVSVAMNAQIYVGGSINFENDDVSTSLTLSPEVGYKLNEKFAIGGVLDFEVTDFKEFKSFTLDVSPYARYTFLKAGNFSLFADATVEFTYDADASDFTFGGVYIKPGAAFAINEQFTLAAHMGMIGYEDTSSTFMINPKSTNLLFSLYYNF